jgi:hypothetical protein
MYSLTIFKNRFDNKTHRNMQFPDWESFVGLLQKLSKVSRAGKQDAELISPAVYIKGTTRSNKNVSHWGRWAAVDVDEHETSGDLEIELRNKFGHWSYVCYSTASSTVEKPKFRLVFPLSRIINADKIRHFWFALNTELESMGDRQTKDLSRMYYVPAKYKNANNFIFCNEGESISVDDLISKHEYVERKGNSFLDRLPAELQKQVIEHRKSQMENRDIRWSSYRDCPFFPKTLAMKYQTINETGWYHTMYCIMVAIAANAIKKQYPITAKEIAILCREFDLENGNWYDKRPMEIEANSALEYAYKNGEI